MSQAVSTMNGKSHFLARMPKQSKDKKQIGELEDKRKESDLKIYCSCKEIESLWRKIGQLEDDQIDNQGNLDKLANLFSLGIIDENGLPITNNME